MIVPFFLAVDFLNFTYATNPCAANVPVPVVMRRGSFSYFDPKMGAGFDVRVAAVTKGSLQSGTRQVVVVLACDFPSAARRQPMCSTSAKTTLRSSRESRPRIGVRTGVEARARFTCVSRSIACTCISARTTRVRKLPSRRTRSAADVL
jgi:hypothetical protein